MVVSNLLDVDLGCAYQCEATFFLTRASRFYAVVSKRREPHGRINLGRILDIALEMLRFAENMNYVNYMTISMQVHYSGMRSLP